MEGSVVEATVVAETAVLVAIAVVVGDALAFVALVEVKVLEVTEVILDMEVAAVVPGHNLFILVVIFVILVVVVIGLVVFVVFVVFYMA